MLTNFLIYGYRSQAVSLIPDHKNIGVHFANCATKVSVPSAVLENTSSYTRESTVITALTVARDFLPRGLCGGILLLILECVSLSVTCAAKNSSTNSISTRISKFMMCMLKWTTTLMANNLVLNVHDLIYYMYVQLLFYV